MQTRVAQIASRIEGRYWNAEERDQLLHYTQSVPQRIEAADWIEKKEEAAIRSVMEALQANYPNYPKFHANGWAKCARDVQLVLRAMVSAMIVDDMSVLEDRVLYWLRSLLAAANLTPAIVRDAYTTLHNFYRQELPSHLYPLVEPYFERVVQVLSDFPEPHTPAV